MMSVVSQSNRLCGSRSFFRPCVASAGAILASLVAWAEGEGKCGWSSYLSVSHLSLCVNKKISVQLRFDVHKPNNKPRPPNCCCVFIGYVNLCRELLGHAPTPLVAATSTHSRHVSPPAHPPSSSSSAMASSPFSPQSPALQDFCEKILER